MLLVLICIIVLLCIIPIIKKIKHANINKKNKKIMFICITVIIVIIIIFGIVKFFEYIPNNIVSKEERKEVESYIFEKYGLELRVIKSKTIYRGDFGFNPGKEYIFILRNSGGYKRYQLNINTYSMEEDLKTILLKDQKVNLVEIK